MKKIINFIFNLIFPINCISCNKEGEWCCDKCFESIEQNKSKNCFVCNKNDFFIEDNICDICVNNIFIDGVFCVFNYKNKIISKLIHYYKYNFFYDIGRYFGNKIVDYIKEYKEYLNNFVVIPVPLNKKRFNSRGFNQSYILANIIAKNFKLKVYDNILLRKRNTNQQAKLNLEDRWDNLNNAFCLNLDKIFLIKNKNILLVDDVITTGSTILECSKVLKNCGVNKIFVISIARA